MVGTFERWGGKIINVSLITEFRVDGADVYLKGAQGIQEVKLEGVAVAFSARYASGVAVPHAGVFVWVSPTRAVSTSGWLACDLGESVIYDQDSAVWPLEGQKLAAAQAFAASLPDQLA